MSNKANWLVGKMGPRQKAKARANLPQLCASCGTTDHLTIDHKLARALGGTNARTNLQLLCTACNHAKSLAEQLVKPQLPPSPRQPRHSTRTSSSGS